MRPIRAILLSTPLAGALLLGGCLEPKPLPDRSAQQRSADREGLFAPVEVRVHPLTRFVREKDEDGGHRIEAHIEMLDQAGDGVKGAGTLSIELYRGSGPVSGVGEKDQLDRWTINLADPKVNAEAYDRVTRTYRVILTGLPNDLKGPDGLTLRIRLTTPTGRQLSSEARLGW